VPERSGTWRVTGACPAGTALHLWAPHYSGTAIRSSVQLTLVIGRFRADHRPVTKTAAMQYLGTVPASGRFTVLLKPEDGGTLPARAIGCLHTDRLTATGARSVRVDGHTLTARLPAGATGTAVVAVPRLAGWRCAMGDAAPRPAGQRLGLVAVALDGRSTDLRCVFRPPGLRAGTAVTAGALLVLCCFTVLRAARRRRLTPGTPC
jgi:hypothetical protein